MLNPFDRWCLFSSERKSLLGNDSESSKHTKQSHYGDPDDKMTTSSTIDRSHRRRYSGTGYAVTDDTVQSLFQRMLHNIIPSAWDVVEMDDAGRSSAMLHPRTIGDMMMKDESSPPTTTTAGMQRMEFPRSWRRRLFLILTEPDTSLTSAIFYFILVISIFLLNIVMMMQTMTMFQFTPDNCQSCGGSFSYMFDDEALPDEDFHGEDKDYECVCPPTPMPRTEAVLKCLTVFFSIEWILRVVLFCPISVNFNGNRKNKWQHVTEYFDYITTWSMVQDFLAIFPYYMELAIDTNGLMSLRLLRCFRVMQLVRLGQYNKTFMSLTKVLGDSMGRDTIISIRTPVSARIGRDFTLQVDPRYLLVVLCHGNNGGIW